MEEDKSLAKANLMAGKETATEISKPKRNKFVIACAVLASTNSILLGYGEFLCFLN